MKAGRPCGWMSPWLSNSEVTMDLLQEAGYRYVMDWTCDDQPIWLKTRQGRMLAMPLSHRVQRYAWHRVVSTTPRANSPTCCVDNFDEMLEQSARQPLVCPISLHPFVVGRPYRIRQLRRVFEHILRYA